MAVIQSEDVQSVLAKPNQEAQTAPPPTVRISSIDGLRALAMFMVFTFHVWEFGDSPALNTGIFGRTVSFGSFFGSLPSGVDLFMVLSGFCLFWPIAKTPARLETWSASDYFKRRFRRIAPPYYAAIIFLSLLPNALVIVYRLAGRPGHWQSLPSVWDYVTHFLFIHTLFLNRWNTIQGAFWSLGLEMQFYVMFPLVILAYRKFGLRVLAAMTILSVVYRYLAGQATKGMMGDAPLVVTIFFLGKWMQFAAGMLAAFLVARYIRTETRIGSRNGTLLLVCCVGLYFAAISGITRLPVLKELPVADVLFAIAYGAAIVALCASSSPASRVFSNRLVTWLGYISYSVFLIHQNTVYYVGEFFKKVRPVSGPIRFLVLETLGFAIIVGVSAVFFKFFEAPFVNDPRKRRVDGTQAVP